MNNCDIYKERGYKIVLDPYLKVNSLEKRNPI
jgi:hypothetical protein